MFQKERKEKELMQQELREARRIQLGLLPGEPPALSGFSLSAVCLPSREVGGDWYDFIPLPDGRLAIVLADVSGKGMGAALLMASTRTVLRLAAETGQPPGEVLSHVNDVLLKDFPTTKFVTMVYGILDADKRSFVFANAGHPPPLFVSFGQDQFLTTDAGLPLGIQEVCFSERTIDLGPGCRCVLYTDGVTEAMNSSMAQYGESRLRDHFARPSSTVQSLLDDIYSFTSGRSASDDITIVVIDTDRGSSPVSE
jgi:sigma-B regulation protein RsbU (phosphoserine phosphatase)